MKFRKFLSFILAIFLSMLPANQSLVLAADSGGQSLIGNKGIFESLIGTSSDAQSGDEFSKPDADDMLGEAPIEYPVWIKDRLVTSENKDDVFGDGKVKYEPASGGERAKLSLNGVNFSVNATGAMAGSYYGCIVAGGDIDINLQGNNVMNIKSEADSKVSALLGMYVMGEINISGGGSLTINIDTETCDEYLSGIIGIMCNPNSTFQDVNITVNMKGFAGGACGIFVNPFIAGENEALNIMNSDINIKSRVGYNDKLNGEGAKEVVLINADNICTIESSKINLELKEREGLTKDEAELAGIAFLSGKEELYILGETAISINSSEYSIRAKEIYPEGNYKVDLSGKLAVSKGSAISGIEFITKGSWFVVRDEEAALVCDASIDAGSADFRVPDGAVVLAGANEDSAQPIAKGDFNKLFKYENNPAAYPGYKFIKVVYLCDISFNANGGSGEMPSTQILSGTKYPLPACAFTPPSGKVFKAWEIGGVEYTAGKSIIIEKNIVINAVWKDKSSGSGGGSGGGGSGGSGGGGSGGSGPGQSSGTWIQDGTGWWYKNSDGSYPKSGWQQIDSVWYAFDDAGYMITGWYLSEGSWYYLSSSGAMATGWIESGGKWYYMSSSGAMSTGWIEVGGKWYYLEPTGREGKPQGSMYTSETTPDGFTVNASGEWVG